jgi:hypothetical protein
VELQSEALLLLKYSRAEKKTSRGSPTRFVTSIHVPSLPPFYRNTADGRREAYYIRPIVPCAVESTDNPCLILKAEEAESAAIPPPTTVAESPTPKKSRGRCRPQQRERSTSRVSSIRRLE